MELRQLRQFVVLAGTLNFHRAAKALNMSQPPLTVSIKKLELELGVTLFERRSRPVRLTPAGLAALPHARDALAAVDSLTHAIRATADGARGRLRIGFVASATYALIPALVPRFRDQFPGIELSLKESTTVELIHALDVGEMDFGIVRTPVMDAMGAVIEPLCHDELMLITSWEHPLGSRDQVRLEDLKDEPFVVYDRERLPNLWSLTTIWCEAAGFLPKISEEVTHVHTLMALVQSGVGVALAPAVMRNAGAKRVRFVKLTAGGAPLRVGLALACRNGERRIIAEAFASVVRGAAKDIDSF